MGLDRKHVVFATITAFVSWLLLTDLIPSLRWIPYAFVTGILATVAGLLYAILSTSRGAQYDLHERRWLSKARPAFARPEAWEEEKVALIARAQYNKAPIIPQARAVSTALDGLLEFLLRDYVTSWYGGISKRLLFQNEVDRAIRAALASIRDRLSTLDVVEIGVSRILPMVTSHIQEFYDAERTVRGKDLSHNVTESDELDMAVAGKFRGGRLHPAASLTSSDTTLIQQSHLRSLVAGLLPLVLPENRRSSPAVTVLVKEIVACAVLGPVMQIFSDPDTWNQMIEAFGRTMLHDRRTVRKLRAALDQHAPPSPAKGRSTQFPRLRPYDSQRQFERFIRAVRHCSTLSDARRFRSEIMSQLRRDAAVEGQDAAYLRRLETGKRLLDQKISSFGAEVPSRPKLKLQSSSYTSNASERKRRAPLREVLHDASGLSYFMEFMDRLKLVRLVQFWIVVDGFRNPLEEDTDEPARASAKAMWTESDRMDIAQMYEAYLTKSELKVSEQSLQAVRHFLRAGTEADIREYMAARHIVLRTQSIVFEEMRDMHFESFKKSDLYFKWLAMEDAPTLSAASDASMSSLSPMESREGRDRSPVKTRKAQLAATGFHGREPELRRTVLSSADLKASSQIANASAMPRRSLDDTGARPALFDDDMDDDRMVQSVSSLRSVESETDSGQQGGDNTEVVDAMQAALDDIMEDKPDQKSLFSEPSIRSSIDLNEQRGSLEEARPALLSRESERDRPSIASLGLVGAPSSRGVFVDDLFGDEEKFPEDDKEDSEANGTGEEDKIHEAAPGDLGLAEAIDALNAEIERLTAQRSIVDSLTSKAELTNNAAELRILKKSEQSLQREIQRKEMQKQQYVVQESDNSLYGRASISIKSIMVGREEDGHEFALYVIEVRRQAGDQMPAATWAVTRRYSQFHELHKRLRARFPVVRDMDFPRRQTLFTLQKDFLQKRRVTLERYLRNLLLVPAICRSRELRAFLSQQAINPSGANGTQIDARDFVTRIYNSVSDGMEEFLGNIPVLDQLSVAGQNLISAATAQMNGVPVGVVDPAAHDPATAAEAEAELNAFESRELEPFVKPICDLFLETFELQKGNSWLRGRTVVVVLHQLLGGTIERKVRDTAKNVLQDDSIAKYVDMVKHIMWPNGKPRQGSTPRTPAEKARSRKEANVLLSTLIPDVAGSVVGKSNAQAASRKISAILNNRRLK